jgi:predicted transcriptional regulator
MTSTKTSSIRYRILKILEDGPRSERTIVYLLQERQDVVCAELNGMQKEDLVYHENIIVSVWRITGKGIVHLGA